MSKGRQQEVSLGLPLFLVALSLAAASALQCYKCGQYNDGVGSITPCINFTHTHLKECPRDTAYCIKYVSEGSIVRDCVTTCTEKEVWGTRTFCCSEPGCNGAEKTQVFTRGILLLLAILAYFHH